MNINRQKDLVLSTNFSKNVNKRLGKNFQLQPRPWCKIKSKTSWQDLTFFLGRGNDKEHQQPEIELVLAYDIMCQMTEETCKKYSFQENYELIENRIYKDLKN